ncbi:hypothetical protein D9M70_543790 [compost metagenome]
MQPAPVFGAAFALAFNLGEIVAEVRPLHLKGKPVGGGTDRQRILRFSGPLRQAFDGGNDLWRKAGIQQPFCCPSRRLFQDIVQKGNGLGLVPLNGIGNALTMPYVGFARLVALAGVGVNGDFSRPSMLLGRRQQDWGAP